LAYQPGKVKTLLWPPSIAWRKNTAERKLSLGDVALLTDETSDLRQKGSGRYWFAEHGVGVEIEVATMQI
jgi:hypothetical protein